MLGQPLDDCRLAHAGLADEHRVVLGAPAEHLDHSQNLGIAADHRVQLALARKLGQVAAVALEHAELGFCRRVGDALAAADFFDGMLDALFGHALIAQDIGGRRVALAGDAQEQVLGRDVLVLELARFLVGHVDDPLEPRGDEHLRHLAAVARCAGLWRVFERLLDLAPDHRHGRVDFLENLGREPIGLLQQRQEQVLGVYLIMLVALQDFVCPHRRILSPLCKTIKSHHSLCPVLKITVRSREFSRLRPLERLKPLLRTWAHSSLPPLLTLNRAAGYFFARC